MTHKYDIILHWSDKDEAFIAKAPDLPGCAASGHTRQIALIEVQVAIAKWIETAIDTGRPIPGLKGETANPRRPVRTSERWMIRTRNLVERIFTMEPGKRSGQPCIRGMRITAADVLGYLDGGMTDEEVLYDFPELTTEDIAACRAFDRLRRKRVVSLQGKGMIL